MHLAMLGLFAVAMLKQSSDSYTRPDYCGPIPQQSRRTRSSEPTKAHRSAGQARFERRLSVRTKNFG